MPCVPILGCELGSSVDAVRKAWAASSRCSVRRLSVLEIADERPATRLRLRGVSVHDPSFESSARRAYSSVVDRDNLGESRGTERRRLGLERAAGRAERRVELRQKRSRIAASNASGWLVAAERRCGPEQARGILVPAGRGGRASRARPGSGRSIGRPRAPCRGRGSVDARVLSGRASVGREAARCAEHELRSGHVRHLAEPSREARALRRMIVGHATALPAWKAAIPAL